MLACLDHNPKRSATRSKGCEREASCPATGSEQCIPQQPQLLLQDVARRHQDDRQQDLPHVRLWSWQSAAA